jgi:hypothetical protein
MSGVDTRKRLRQDDGHGDETALDVRAQALAPHTSSGRLHLWRVQVGSARDASPTHGPQTSQRLGVSRFQHGPMLRPELRAAEPRAACWCGDRPLLPGERPICERDDHVPEQLSTTDGAVAAWIATSESLRDPALAFRVIGRAPDLDAIPERGATFDADAARAAVRDLRAGKAVATSIVVRLACHMLETK